MARIIGIGDNTVDLYVDKGLQFPGGNAVNVAVLAHRLGADTSYLGCLGTDGAGRLILDSLRAEGVDVSRCRTIEGRNSWSRILHRGADRIFDGSNPGVRDNYNLGAEDEAFLARHDLAHSSVYSGLEGFLGRIRRAAGQLSFDYSSDSSESYRAATAPEIDIAFVSNPALEESACRALAVQVGALGPEIVVVMRGAGPVIAYRDGAFSVQPIPRVKVVDTLGAGDGFIAAFLVTWLETKDIGQSLRRGVEYAGVVCGYYGAFGYAVPIPPEQPRAEQRI